MPGSAPPHSLAEVLSAEEPELKEPEEPELPGDEANDEKKEQASTYARKAEKVAGVLQEYTDKLHQEANGLEASARQDRARAYQKKVHGSSFLEEDEEEGVSLPEDEDERREAERLEQADRGMDLGKSKLDEAVEKMRKLQVSIGQTADNYAHEADASKERLRQDMLTAKQRH